MRKIKLNKEQKIALARLVSDLIEADFIVEQYEMEYFETLKSKDYYNISNDMLVEAKQLTMQDAINCLKSLDKQGRHVIVQTLQELSLSDGVCVPLEAIQIFAIEQSLEDNASIFSIPAMNVDIENMKVIYIENKLHASTSKSIESQFRPLSNELSLAGFDLVLIPSVVKDFVKMDEQYLKKVIGYMIPSASIEKVTAICKELRTMTTMRFCEELLSKKLDIRIGDMKPSLLFKINESDLLGENMSDHTGRVRYANFLCIELKKNIVEQVRQLMDRYRGMLNKPILVSSRPLTSKFIYSGFHQSLFNLIAFHQEATNYRLEIDLTLRHHGVQFTPVSDSGARYEVKLPEQELVLYAMVVRKSIEGGSLDWREQMPQEDRNKILEEYNAIYRIIKPNSRNYVYKNAVQMSHIVKKMKCYRNVIPNIDDFIPKHGGKRGQSSFFSVSATSDFVIFIT